MNLYDLVNKEMERMYDLWKIEKELHFKELVNPNAIKQTNSWMHGTIHEANASELMREIKEFRTMIAGQFANHDQKIQEKIAELALTSKE